MLLLVIECVSRYNWKQLFQGARLELKDDEEIRVEQATWDEISLVSYPNNLVVTAAASERPEKREQRTRRSAGKSRIERFDAE
mmetsp:Transcript_48085/g.94394  ORF Transcript_48085/g.94394 Transcript_48085/m.94394 type:complete len:83 (-) Transcript_48085:272-520(-)